MVPLVESVQPLALVKKYWKLCKPDWVKLIGSCAASIVSPSITRKLVVARVSLKKKG